MTGAEINISIKLFFELAVYKRLAVCFKAKNRFSSNRRYFSNVKHCFPVRPIQRIKINCSFQSDLMLHKQGKVLYLEISSSARSNQIKENKNTFISSLTIIQIKFLIDLALN